jgi:hypothetical protein
MVGKEHLRIGPQKINETAGINGRVENLLGRLAKKNPRYVDDLNWPTEQKEGGKFISIRECVNRLGAVEMLDERFRVTLEISALQFFPWLVAEARQAIAKGELMPGRFIRGVPLPSPVTSA